MRLEQLAQKIPAEYRSEILQMNMIDKAQAITTDPTMHYLGIIWQQYVDSTYSADCNLCCTTLLNNYRKLLPVFIELERKRNLLKSA